MTTVIVFVGPTLPPKVDCPLLEAIYLPPAAQGDLFRAVMHHKPDVIGVIDGYFHLVPSVRHKEILWAMAEGIHVFGSASMGALRAAELSSFGMVGVGSIYEAYARSELNDDDEVAVIHGPAELGYPSLSDAMIDIRVTLRTATDLAVISPATETGLTDIAKGLFFQDRSYSRMMEKARSSSLPAVELDAFETWLPGGKVSQKRDDAILMLKTIADLIVSDLPKKKVTFYLEKTYSLDQE